MKLQQEYAALKAKVESLDRSKVILYKDKLRVAGGYNNFDVRFAHDVLFSVMSSSDVCGWYDKYNCDDSHITTLAVKVCKDVGILD